MLVKKGTVVNVRDSRKGKYVGIATKDFDTENDEWYDVSLHQDEPVRGMNTVWEKGDDIPCRKGLSVVTLAE